MASLHSLEPRTPTEAMEHLSERARKRADGIVRPWTVGDVAAVRVLARHFRTKVRRAK